MNGSYHRFWTLKRKYKIISDFTSNHRFWTLEKKYKIISDFTSNQIEVASKKSSKRRPKNIPKIAPKLHQSLRRYTLSGEKDSKKGLPSRKSVVKKNFQKQIMFFFRTLEYLFRMSKSEYRAFKKVLLYHFLVCEIADT